MESKIKCTNPDSEESFKGNILHIEMLEHAQNMFTIPTLSVEYFSFYVGFWSRNKRMNKTKKAEWMEIWQFLKQIFQIFCNVTAHIVLRSIIPFCKMLFFFSLKNNKQRSIRGMEWRLSGSVR
jgi:anaerobic ribonucleoside-triphosphate reductase